MNRPLLGAVALLAATAAGTAHAELQIVDFEVRALARAPQGGQGVEVLKTSDVPLGVPWALTAQVDATTGPNALEQIGNAAATQTKTGWFHSQAIANHGWTPTSSEMWSGTLFYMLLETNTPDTPMVLNFSFLGSRARIDPHYGIRDVDMDVEAYIATAMNPAAGVIPDEQDAVWGFRDNIGHLNGYTFASSITDTQGIGTPTRSTVDEWVEMRHIAEVERDAFFGTLDFGLLQPGERFAIAYYSNTNLRVESNYATAAVVEVKDPFSLENTPPQFTMAGLTLPAAPVPEPSTYALFGAGLLALTKAARSRPRRTLGVRWQGPSSA
jgi:hypothetical protein